MQGTRRHFLAGLGLGAGAALGGIFHLAGGKTAAATLLRPPGASSEAEFLAACLRCGQCVEACPHGTLFLAGSSAGTAVGTPCFDPVKIPCKLCEGLDDLKCITACPTAALRPVGDLSDIQIGTAVIDEEICLAYNRVSCRACYHNCPLPDKAIVFDDMLRPKVDAEACIGCGICTLACLTEPTSIPIRPHGASIPAGTSGEGKS